MGIHTNHGALDLSFVSAWTVTLFAYPKQKCNGTMLGADAMWYEYDSRALWAKVMDRTHCIGVDLIRTLARRN